VHLAWSEGIFNTYRYFNRSSRQVHTKIQINQADGRWVQ